MNKKTLVAFLPAIVLLAFWTAGTFIVGQQVPAPAAHAATFDHSGCQYPDRWTNPVDGCDNSDPAVPECIKAAFSEESEKACIDKFVQAHSCAGYPNGVCESCTLPGSCPGKTDGTPDPDRDYYDAAGNLYDYQSNLKQAAPAEAVDPSTCTGK